MNVSRYFLLLLPAIALGQDNPTAPSSNSDHIVIQELVITGVRTLASSQLADIEHTLTALEMRRDDEELQERLRNAFQERGYFDANVKSVEIKPLDPLARPTPVRVETEVDEGPRYKLAGFKFLNNHVISAAELQTQFPIHRGDFFSTDKIRAGLEAVAKLYRSKGYVEEIAVPDATERSSNAVLLAVEIKEGTQYRMGKLEIGAEPELARQLERKWSLRPGQPFDANYPAKFAEDNSSLLPKAFNLQTGSHISLDCHDLIASIQFQLDPDHSLQPTPNRLDCDQPNESNPVQTNRPHS
jgi:outer membrane protein assembly factor BamA